jgi:hypothetical protein
MSTSRIATMIVTLAACEHADHVEPAAPQLATPAPVPADAAPLIAPVVPADAAPIVEKKPLFDEDKLDRQCMSRAGCKWKGEKTGSRVTKKPEP